MFCQCSEATPSALVAAMLAFFIVSCLFPGSVTASDQTTGSADEKHATHNATVLEAVIVTAQKREEDVQDVAISMDVFSGETLEDAGVMDLTELTYFSPNVYSKQNTNQNMIIMRGLSSHNVVLNTPAGLFVDGVNYPMTFMQNPDLLDIERVEALRGPQGTLYGRNTESGAINIITKQPNNELRGKLFLEPSLFTTDERTSPMLSAGASINAPIISDALFMSASVKTKHSNGFTRNSLKDRDDAGKINHLMGQCKLRWLPSSSWDITLLASGFSNDDGYGHLHYIDGPDASDPYTMRWDGGNEWKDESNSQALHIKYQGDVFDVASITTRNDYTTAFRNDGEFGSVPTPDQNWRFEHTSFSQELRLSSPDTDSPFEWLVGTYLFKDDNDALAEYFGKSITTEFENVGYALFGQASYTFFERLKLTGGLRYDILESEGEQRWKGMNSYKADVDHGELLPKAALSFDLTDEVMLYATVARGLLAGGYDYAFAQDSKSLTFDLESTWNYEIGAKSSWLDRALLLNIAAFYIDIKDKQVQEYLAGPAVRNITNAASASSTGLEVELSARPAKGWSLFGGFGYAVATVEDWVSDEMTGGSYDYGGKRLPFAPEYTFNLGAQYDHSSGLYARADVLGVGDFYCDIKNESKVSGYATLNLRLGYKGESFELSAWGKNILNKEYLTSKSYYFGGNIAEEGEPRSIGLSLAYYF